MSPDKRYPGYDTYTGRWCKCGHREEDHSGGNNECYGAVEIIEGFGETCSCYRFSDRDLLTSSGDSAG